MTTPDNAPAPAPVPAPVTTKFVGWDDRTILKALGWNPQAVRRALMSQKQGTPDTPSDWAIYQWTSRSKIAAEWRPRLLYTALRLDRIELVEAFKVLEGPTPAPAETTPEKDAA